MFPAGPQIDGHRQGRKIQNLTRQTNANKFLQNPARLGAAGSTGGEPRVVPQRSAMRAPREPGMAGRGHQDSARDPGAYASPGRGPGRDGDATLGRDPGSALRGHGSKSAQSPTPETGSSVRMSMRKSGNSALSAPEGPAQDGPTDKSYQGTERPLRQVTLEGTLTVSCPGGPVDIRTLFDTGSEADAVSHDKAVELRQMGVSWGAAGGNLTVANSGEVRPVGSLRLLLTAEPKRVSQGSNPETGSLGIPRSLTFCTDVEIVDSLTAELIIGYPTLTGTGLLGVVLGNEEYEPDEDRDIDELDELWPDLNQNEFAMPTLMGTAAQRRQLRLLCLKYKELFGPVPKGGSKLPPMDLKLKKDANGLDMQPRRHACRHVAPWINQLIKDDAEMRIKNGWMKWGESPYASAVVAAKQPAKGPNARRICADYKDINDCVVETRYPVKNQEEVTRRLAGSKSFSSLDFQKGFHQLPLTEFAQQLLAVVTSWGMLIPLTAPFGVHSLPSHFQYNVSQRVMHGLEGNGVETFVDDINVHGGTFEEMYQRLEEVFKRLSKWDLRLNGKKCVLGNTECVFLGHRVDGKGHQHTENRTSGVSSLQRPYDKTQLKSFLGLTNYFRQHLGIDFADVAKPLVLMTGRKIDFSWDDSCQQAFEEIKRRIVANPKLYFLDYGNDIYIRCDASKMGCGGQLFQVVEGKDRPVAYISRSFTPTEQKWSTLEMELFAVVWCMKRWASMIEGCPVTVLCDHKNVLQLMKAVAPKIVRWRLMLQQFNYRVLHVEGKDSKHAVADCLSRLHGPPPKLALSAAAITRAQSSSAGSASKVDAGPTAADVPSPELEALASSQTQDGAAREATSGQQEAGPPGHRKGPISPEDASAAKAHVGHGPGAFSVTDPKQPGVEVDIAVMGESRPVGRSGTRGRHGKQPQSASEREQICRTCTNGYATTAEGAVTDIEDIGSGSQPIAASAKSAELAARVTPEQMQAFRQYHNDLVGHFGRDIVYRRLMQAKAEGTMDIGFSKRQVQACIDQCSVCQKLAYNKKRTLPAPRNFISSAEPFQEVSIDAFGPMIPDKVNGHTYGLVAVCNFSRFVVARSAPDTSAESAARFIIELGGTFGFPKRLKYDNCSQFANHLVKALTNLVGIDRNPSVPFVPETNGIVERGIKEVLRHVKCIVNLRRNHDDWASMLPIAVRIMNAERHAGIGVSPAEIILPGVNLNRNLFPGGSSAAVKEGADEITSKHRKEEILKWVKHLQALQASAIREARQHREVLEYKIKEKAPDEISDFEPGQWVVAKPRGGKTSKLAVEWKGPYLILKKPTSTTYEIQDPADQRTYVKHARELALYNMGHGEDPRETIAMDEVEFLVEAILDHDCRNSTRKSDFDFLVTWKNQGPEENAWVPYHEVAPLEAFDRYIREHPELRRYGLYPDDTARPKAARRPAKQRRKT